MKPALRLALSLGIAAGLLGALLLVGGIRPAEILAGLGKLSLRVYLTALGLQVALYAFRAARFRLLLRPGRRVGLGRLLSITSAYTMASLVLPAKLGEASFVVYADRVAGVPATEGTACLLVSRLLDMATLALGTSVTCLALWDADAYPGLPWLGSLGAALLPMSALLYAASARGDLVLRLLARLSRLLGIERTRTGTKLLGIGERLAGALRTAGSRRRLTAAALLTVPCWICIFLFCAVLARGLGLPETTTFAEANFATAMAITTSLLPVSAFANFGTLEAGWVLGLHALGVEPELAAATGFGLHLVQIANAVLLGLLGHVGMALASERAEA